MVEDRCGQGGSRARTENPHVRPRSSTLRSEHAWLVRASCVTVTLRSSKRLGGPAVSRGAALSSPSSPHATPGQEVRNRAAEAHAAQPAGARRCGRLPSWQRDGQDHAHHRASTPGERRSGPHRRPGRGGHHSPARSRQESRVRFLDGESFRKVMQLHVFAWSYRTLSTVSHAASGGAIRGPAHARHTGRPAPRTT